MDDQGQHVEEWSRKAHILSNADPLLGTVLTKSLNLMTMTTKGGIDAPNLSYAMKSMRRERELAMEMDPNKEEPLRHVVYSMSENLEAMINSLIARDKERVMNEDGVEEHIENHEDVADVLPEGNEPLFPKEEAADAFMMNEVKEEERLQYVPMQQPQVLQPQLVDAASKTMGRNRAKIAEAWDEDEGRDEDELNTPARKRARNESESDYEEEVKSSGKSKTIHRCKQCSKVFRGSYELACHMRQHTGEKPYACTKCKSAYARSNHLQAHLRNAHGAKPYECKTCDARYGNLQELREHWKKEGHKWNIEAKD